MLGARVALLFANMLMNTEHLGNLVGHLKNWIESGLGLLENHGNPVAPHLDHFIFAGLDQIFAFEEDFSPGNFPRAADQAHDRK